MQEINVTLMSLVTLKFQRQIKKQNLYYQTKELSRFHVINDELPWLIFFV